MGQVQDWLASGLSCRAFAARSGVHVATLSWWKRKLESEGQDLSIQKTQPHPAFVEVTSAIPIVDHSASDERIEIEVGNVKVRLPCDFPESTLSRVFDVLEARS